LISKISKHHCDEYNENTQSRKQQYQPWLFHLRTARALRSGRLNTYNKISGPTARFGDLAVLTPAEGLAN